MGVAAMSLGIIEECLDQSVKYAKERVQFGHPIADYQLIQLKLANMEIARVNVQNMVFRADRDGPRRQAAITRRGVGREGVQLAGGD